MDDDISQANSSAPETEKETPAPVQDHDNEKFQTNEDNEYDREIYYDALVSQLSSNLCSRLFPLDSVPNR